MSSTINFMTLCLFLLFIQSCSKNDAHLYKDEHKVTIKPYDTTEKLSGVKNLGKHLGEYYFVMKMETNKYEFVEVMDVSGIPSITNNK